MRLICHARFHKQFEKLVEYAEENINFDAHQLQILRKTQAEEITVPKMIQAINQTLEALVEILKDEYNLFKKIMLKELSILQQLKDRKRSSKYHCMRDA